MYLLCGAGAAGARGILERSERHEQRAGALAAVEAVVGQGVRRPAGERRSKVGSLEKALAVAVGPLRDSDDETRAAVRLLSRQTERGQRGSAKRRVAFTLRRPLSIISSFLCSRSGKGKETSVADSISQYEFGLLIRLGQPVRHLAQRVLCERAARGRLRRAQICLQDFESLAAAEADHLGVVDLGVWQAWANEVAEDRSSEDTSTRAASSRCLLTRSESCRA